MKRIPFGQAAWLYALRQRRRAVVFVRALHSYYQPVRLPVSVHRCRVPSGFTARTMNHHPWPETGSPGSRISNFRTCTGSTTTRGRKTFLQITNDSMLPSGPKTPLAPRSCFSFRGSIPGPHVPLSTLRAHGYPNARMTRGQYGLLLLYCKRLSLSVTHRFTPAHRRSKRPDRLSQDC